MTKSLVELERYLSRLKDSGALPALSDAPRAFEASTYISANPPPRRRASG
jgi:hypothetical protein